MQRVALCHLFSVSSIYLCVIYLKSVAGPFTDYTLIAIKYGVLHVLV